MVTGCFATFQFPTWMFRYQLRRFATWTLCYLDDSPPGRFATTLDDSSTGRYATWTLRYHLRRFATWTLCYLDDSPPGHFATWTFHNLDVSHLWTFRYQDVSLPPWTFHHRMTKNFLPYHKLQTFRQVAKRPGK